MEQFSEYNYRGPRIFDVEALKAQGIKRIISLETNLDYDLYKTDELTQNGIEVIRIRCSDVLPPTREQVSQALNLLIQPVKTYLHCYSGVDRTGFMVAVCRMQCEGWSFDKAHQEWVDKGRHIWFFWWKYALKKYEHHG